jgi:hypothetical protein
MNKKLYVTPEMVIEDVKLDRCIMIETSGPKINDDWEGGDEPIVWPDDE